ncbi:dihydropteroate synthase [Aliidiomarina sanyensis]|uniref:Dihydropteroate synthase n=1 Tax=Aliidiomarina sanyensis TaxID=1249555 RepID=A0A432WES9_9GAMM|nr:dihydropteroate synthase [Aliidiomarina sanyensis]RUO31403.1 dihydropteroate synthase [Aliidiomarina sanyensis]
MSRAYKPAQVMGILNVTPDSFSDGGRFVALDAAVQQADRMCQEGADWIDVGGESTRPGAAAVSEQEELDRVIPVIERISATLPVKVSIDTSKAAVMRAAVQAGAKMINDVRALQEPGALTAAAEMYAAFGSAVCLMHMQGLPRTMQDNPQYDDVITDIRAFFTTRIEACRSVGISHDAILLDPGFGFGKSMGHNYELLRKLEAFHDFEKPLLVGVSRKSMLGHVTGKPVNERLPASIAAATIAMLKGASILRVHDVGATRDAVHVVTATVTGEC